MILIKTLLPMDAIQLAKWMKQVNQALVLVKLMIGLAFSCGCGMVGVVLWFSHTTDAIASTQQRMDAYDKEEQIRIKEWSTWRMDMERTSVRMLAIQEAQQKLMERLTDRVDRLSAGR